MNDRQVCLANIACGQESLTLKSALRLPKRADPSCTTTSWCRRHCGRLTSGVRSR